MPAVLPSSAEEGTADAPASAGVVLVKKLNSARFLAGQVQRVKDRSVLKVQNSKFPCARSSLRMKSDSRAFSAKCPTPSKSTATKFLLHNLRSWRHPATPPPQESILTAVAYVSFQPQIMYLLPHFIY